MQISRFARFPIIHWRLVGQLRSGNVGHDLSTVFHHHPAAVGHDANLRPRQVPLVENPLYFLFAALVNDDQHALLRFAKHDFVGRHVRDPLRNLAQINLDAGAGAGGGFASGTGQTRRAHGAGGEQLQAGFQQQLFHERVPHLHRAALLPGRFPG